MWLCALHMYIHVYTCFRNMYTHQDMGISENKGALLSKDPITQGSMLSGPHCLALRTCYGKKVRRRGGKKYHHYITGTRYKV